jgi:hypothetical protein
VLHSSKIYPANAARLGPNCRVGLSTGDNVTLQVVAQVKRPVAAGQPRIPREGSPAMSTSSSGTADASRSRYGSIAIVGALFFIFGFVTWLNGPLISFAKLAFDVSDTLAFLIPSAFYISYFFLALPSSLILRRTG